MMERWYLMTYAVRSLDLLSRIISLNLEYAWVMIDYIVYKKDSWL